MGNDIRIQISDDVVLVKAGGISSGNSTVSALFRTLAEDGVPVDFVSLVAEQNNPLTFAVSGREIAKVLKAAAQCRENSVLRFSVRGGYSKITLSGSRLPSETGMASACFRALGIAGVEPAFASVSSSMLSILVPTDALDRTLTCLEDIFHTTA